MAHSPNPLERPPYPERLRWWTGWRVERAGRRDRRASAPPDPDGHLPFTRQLAASSHEGFGQVGEWLSRRLDAVDGAIATAQEAISDSHRQVAWLEAHLADAEALRTSAETVEARVGAAREAMRLRSARDLHRQRASSSSADLARLVASRLDQVEAARSAAAVWQARYERLAARYRRGYLRRRRHLAPQPWSMPALPPFPAPWTSGDVPIVVPVIDLEALPVLRVSLTRLDRESATP